jgi:uncharacterized protein (DUF1499 family)
MDRKISKWALGSILFGILAALLLVSSGYGYQWGWWELRIAFTWFIPGSAVAGLIGFSLAVVFSFADWGHAQKTGGGIAMLGLLLSLGVMVTVGYWFLEAQKYPPIHDITTDLENPPKFRAIVPLRANAANDTAYGGQEVADLQRKYYPDVQRLYLHMKYDEAFNRALQTAKQMPWEQIVSSDLETGIIEAVDKLPWFGFVDDVVIRVDTADAMGNAQIDVRSVSRIGRGDIGVNAQRIRKYLKAIKDSYSK